MKFQRKYGESFPQCDLFASRRQRWLICNRLAILLLLIALAGLAARAKDGQYHRRTNPEHESSLATKMNVSPPAINLRAQPLRTVARVTVQQPRPSFRPRMDAEPPLAESIGVTVAMQHRSPPESLHS